MKRFKSIISRRNSPLSTRSNEDLAQGDTPEANITRSIKLFCESSTGAGQGEEVLHLPVIVEAAESSPSAAGTAATHIRKYLSPSHSAQRPHVQYNAVMLIRILADNPGPTFTRNFDSKFVGVVKEVLRYSKDPSVQQILRETLASLYAEKAYDTNLTPLFTMWQKESGSRGPAPNVTPTYTNGASNSGLPAGVSVGRGSRRQLPAPEELAARIEESKTSAKLLVQLVQSTPQAELQSNELIKEFAERCQTAQRSVQIYINADSPPPDDDTMQTLIETTEQLSLALSKHSRAVLQARRANGGGTPTSPPPGSNGIADPPAPNLPPRAGLGIADQQPLIPVQPPPASDPAATYAPSGTTPTTAYAPPPLPPPAAAISRRPISSLPPAAAAAPTAQQSSIVQPIRNPREEPDDAYSPPPLPPPSHTTRPPVPPARGYRHDDSSDEDDVADPFADSHDVDNAASATAAAAVGGPPPAPSSGGGGAFRPKIAPGTSSYVRRQDNAETHLSMHGANSPPVSPERGVRTQGVIREEGSQTVGLLESRR